MNPYPSPLPIPTNTDNIWLRVINNRAWLPRIAGSAPRGSSGRCWRSRRPGRTRTCAGRTARASRSRRRTASCPRPRLWAALGANYDLQPVLLGHLDHRVLRDEVGVGDVAGHELSHSRGLGVGAEHFISYLLSPHKIPALYKIRSNSMKRKNNIWWNIVSIIIIFKFLNKVSLFIIKLNIFL